MTLAAGAETAGVRFAQPVHPAWSLLPLGLLIAAGLIACSLLLLFDPAQRSVYAILAILLSIAALLTSHLGGYLLGTLLGLAGGAVAFAWVPSRPAPPAPAPAGLTLIRGDADLPAAGRPGAPARPARPGRPRGSQRNRPPEGQHGRQRDRD